MGMNSLLYDAAERASRYLDGLATRPVGPTPAALARLQALDVPLQSEPLDPRAVLAELDEIGSPATVASAGGRYFGFVTGGALPAALAAQWLAGAWDQNAMRAVTSPVAAWLEAVGRRWLVDLFGLPADAGVGFVTGATMANLTALAAARQALLARAGWDVEAQGLFGAPPLTVVVSEEVHVSVLKALGLLGLGRERVIRVPVDAQGRLRAAALPALSAPTVVCLQAGNVNTGAFDPIDAVCDVAQAAGAWVHIDGAFGLWAAACPAYRALTRGLARADSWATDAHKWLNVPYDSGLALVREPAPLYAAMAARAAYLPDGAQPEPSHATPELSRRARGVEIWAALRSLGRAGLAELIDRNCRFTRRLAEGLRAAGYAVLNEVVLNQALVSFGDAARTQWIVERIQAEGSCWCGGTVWRGRTAMRLSVSSWATTEADVERSLQAILHIAADTPSV